MDRGAWRVTVYGVTESDTTEQLSTVTKLAEPRPLGKLPHPAVTIRTMGRNSPRGGKRSGLSSKRALCLWAPPGLTHTPHHARRGSASLLSNTPTRVHSTRPSVRIQSPPSSLSTLRLLRSQKFLPVVSLSAPEPYRAVYTADAQSAFLCRMHADTLAQVIAESKRRWTPGHA